MRQRLARDIVCLDVLTMSSPPAVSIILPAYNSAAFLAVTLSSIYAQDFGDYEIIVIDDGSTDATSRICEQQGGRIRLVRQDNQGIAESRNTGIRHALGRYIAFIDHDDYWHPNKLSTQIRVLDNAEEDVAVCFSEFAQWNGVDMPGFDSTDISSSEIDPELSGWIYHQLLLTNWVLFSTAVFRRCVFDAIGLFDRDLPPGDDWDIAIRASRKYKFVKLRSVLALYRLHAGQTSRKAFPRDFQGELRESMILRYGLAGPDGSMPDADKLRDRRLRSRLSFASMHAQAGSMDTAVAALVRATAFAPFDRRTWQCAFGVVRSALARNFFRQGG